MKQTGDVVFITGCSSGFGKEFALEFLRRGYRVIATSRKLSDLDYLDKNENLLCAAVDVSDCASISAAAQSAVEKFGGIDILVNNAGIHYSASIEDFDEQKARALLETNLFGAIFSTRELLQYMSAGTIINISSASGFSPIYSSIFYGISKTALDAITLSIRNSGKNIKAMSVNPGVFNTDIFKKSLCQTDPDFANNCPSPQIVATELLNALEHQNNELPFRLIIGRDSLKRYKKTLIQMDKDYKFAKSLQINHPERKKKLLEKLFRRKK